MADIRSGDVVVDPMCGGGSIGIEVRCVHLCVCVCMCVCVCVSLYWYAHTHVHEHVLSNL